MYAVECKNLLLGYAGTPVAAEISFRLEQGSYLCIVGENGSGKTTFMKAVLGLVKPLGGSVTIKTRGIGYMPQRTPVQSDFPASVYEIVLSGLCGKSKLGLPYSREKKRIALSAMERTEVSHLAKKGFRALSGGQQQRVLLARAICAANEMLLLDEPTAGLDSHSAEKMYGTLRSLNRDDGMTVITVTHDLPRALSDATHVLRISRDNCDFMTKEKYLGGTEA